MKQFTPKSAALFTLSSGMMALLMQACGGDGDAHAQTASTPDPIEGLWQSNVSLKDCNSGAAIGGFRGLTTFQQGGTASADNNQPSATKGWRWAPGRRRRRALTWSTSDSGATRPTALLPASSV